VLLRIDLIPTSDRPLSLKHYTTTITCNTPRDKNRVSCPARRNAASRYSALHLCAKYTDYHLILREVCIHFAQATTKAKPNYITAHCTRLPPPPVLSARAVQVPLSHLPPDGASKARTVLFFGWKTSREDDAHESQEPNTQEQQLHGLSLLGVPDKGTGIRDCFRLDGRPSGWGSVLWSIWLVSFWFRRLRLGH